MPTLADPLSAQVATLQNDTLRQALNDDLKRSYLEIMRTHTQNVFLPRRAVEHSPLPWTLVDNDWEIWDADECSIVCVGHDSSTAWGRMVDALNGQLIVKAVNAWSDPKALQARIEQLEEEGAAEEAAAHAEYQRDSREDR